MASIQSRRKEVDKNCFICLDRKRHYSVRTYQGGKVLSLLSNLIGDDVIELANRRNLGICRPCTETLQKANQFISKLHVAMDTLNTTTETLKCEPVIPYSRRGLFVHKIAATSDSPAKANISADSACFAPGHNVLSNDNQPETDIKYNLGAVEEHFLEHSYFQVIASKQDGTNVQNRAADQNLATDCDQNMTTNQSRTTEYNMANNTYIKTEQGKAAEQSRAAVQNRPTEQSSPSEQNNPTEQNKATEQSNTVEQNTATEQDKSTQQKPAHEYMSLAPLAIRPDSTTHSKYKEIIFQVISNPIILQAVQAHIIQEMDARFVTLASRNAVQGSVLSRCRSISSIVENGDQLLSDIVREIAEKFPFLLDIFTMMVTTGREANESKIAPVAAAYAILMNARGGHLSAWHRLITVVVSEGHLEDSALKRLNHLGLTLSTSSKMRLMAEARKEEGMTSGTFSHDSIVNTEDNIGTEISVEKQSAEPSSQYNGVKRIPVKKKGVKKRKSSIKVRRAMKKKVIKFRGPIVASTIAEICNKVDTAINMKKKPEICNKVDTAINVKKPEMCNIVDAAINVKKKLDVIIPKIEIE